MSPPAEMSLLPICLLAYPDPHTAASSGARRVGTVLPEGIGRWECSGDSWRWGASQQEIPLFFPYMACRAVGRGHRGGMVFVVFVILCLIYFDSFLNLNLSDSSARCTGRWPSQVTKSVSGLESPQVCQGSLGDTQGLVTCARVSGEVGDVGGHVCTRKGCRAIGLSRPRWVSG